MPDWSYQTLFRPLLFGLASKPARNFTLHAMGALSKLPGGRLLIQTLGHMESFPILETNRFGIDYAYPVGLSGTLDIHGVAPRALAQFGLGFMEVGPITLKPIMNEQPILRDTDNEAILYPDIYVNDGLEVISKRLEHQKDYPLPVFIRTRHSPGSSPREAYLEQQQLMDKLLPKAAGCYIDGLDDAWSFAENVDFISDLMKWAQAQYTNKPIFLYVPSDFSLDKLKQLYSRLEGAGIRGIVFSEWIKTSQGYSVGKVGKALCLERVAVTRTWYGRELLIIASAGVHEPQDALDFLHAGSDYVQLHSGLVYSGPGLPKRINEAIIYERVHADDAPKLAPMPSFWKSWGWMYLLGIGMIVGGIIAWIIAATSVVLPYDLNFLGLDRASIDRLNDRLLPFMSHDRITLAGTMISIGVMYAQLAKHGLRKGLHWARTALMASCIVGFSSFFLYLGYGYLDPLHALAAAILLPMFLLSTRHHADRPSLEKPNLVNDQTWRLAQWGQLMFVVLGVSLAVGGLVIAYIGINQVFVPTDLLYLCTSSEMLNQLNERLIPIIAHDRAGFGGALFSNALAILTTALWGIGQGQRWLWWTLLVGGMPGFIAGFSVHAAIGYTDFIHLSPAYFAFLIYVIGLILLYPYLMGKSMNKQEQA
jgi:dihydroorotate dehydrogenase